MHLLTSIPILKTKWWIASAMAVTFIASHAQRREQLWLDFQVDYPFANQYLFEVTTSYQTLLTSENKWRNFSLTPTFEYLRFTRLDLIANLPMAYTIQTDTANSFEISPMLGARIHITQNKRIDTRLLFKLEHRAFRQLDADDWDASNRVRLKAEAWISINGPNLFTNKLWYAIVDYEEFVVVDQQLDERYASRRRGRIGLGYRQNYQRRYEIIYTRQSSRNAIETGFIQGDNVIQLRYKWFLNPAKTAAESED